MLPDIKAKKICQGSYEYTLNGYTVDVDKHDFGWVAKATWCNDLYTDPVDTKKEAVYNAYQILLEVN